jgi:hypothetical protein
MSTTATTMVIRIVLSTSGQPHSVYFPDNLDGYDRDDAGDRHRPVDVVVHDYPLLQRIAINPGGCGGSQYSLSVASSDTSFPPGMSTLAALAALAALAREDLNDNDNPSSCRCARSPTPTSLVPPPNRHRCHCIRNCCVCCRPPNWGRDGRRQALRTTITAVLMVLLELPG